MQIAGREEKRDLQRKKFLAACRSNRKELVTTKKRKETRRREKHAEKFRTLSVLSRRGGL